MCVYEGKGDTSNDVKLGNMVEVTGRLSVIKGVCQIFADSVKLL